MSLNRRAFLQRLAVIATASAITPDLLMLGARVEAKHDARKIVATFPMRFSHMAPDGGYVFRWSATL